MNNKDLQEKIIFELLINKYKNETVSTELVKTIENEFNQIIGELEEKKENTKGMSISELSNHLQ